MPEHEDEPPTPILQQDLPPYERDGYQELDNYDDADPAAGDALVLENLRSMGADLTKSRHVVHYFYFPTDEGRASAEIRLRDAEYQTRYGVKSSGDRPWSLIAERTGIVNEMRVAAERELLTHIARQEDGDYVGWEAQLD